MPGQVTPKSYHKWAIDWEWVGVTVCPGNTEIIVTEVYCQIRITTFKLGKIKLNWTWYKRQITRIKLDNQTNIYKS